MLDANRLEVTTKPIIKLLYIEYFHLNNQRQDNFSLLCIEFQFSTYISKKIIYIFEMQVNLKFCFVSMYELVGLKK
jgi:hypothetical protein